MDVGSRQEKDKDGCGPALNGGNPTAASLYGLDNKVYRRFTEQDHCIYRFLYDPDFKFFHQGLRTGMEKKVDSGEPGFTRMDLALAAAAWTINKHMPFAFEVDPPHSPQDYIPEAVKTRRPDEIPPDVLTSRVKRAAAFFGASLVGIAKIDTRWVYRTKVAYTSAITRKDPNQATRGSDGAGSSGSSGASGSHDADDPRDDGRNGNDDVTGGPVFPLQDLPAGVTRAVVMAVEMDAVAMGCAPTFLEFAAAGLGYSKMSFLIACMAQFIRNLGYRAHPCANDTALSIPLAIDAGLGALGRNGLLVTRDLGPRVRLCKVLTDMPLVPDGPDEVFIQKVTSTCETCLKCANACEKDAISRDTKPSYATRCISNNPGVKKWYVDVERCYEAWVEFSSDCGKCIAVCPFSRTPWDVTPGDFWDDHAENPRDRL